MQFRHWFSMAAYGVIGLYMLNGLEYWSLQHLSSAKACFLYSLSPFLSALFSYFHFRERINRRKWLGLFIGAVGILPVLSIHTGTESLVGGMALLSWPEIGMFGAVLCSSYGWVILRIVNRTALPVMSNGVGMVVGGLFALTHSLLTEPWNPIPVPQTHWQPFLVGFAAITIISNVICNNLYGSLLKRFTATFLSFMGMLSPFFASVSSWLFLGEEFSLTILFSTCILILGLWFVYSAELKQGYIQKPSAALST
jgi:drug/metabolite transporter (DMT)-like permease